MNKKIKYITLGMINKIEYKTIKTYFQSKHVKKEKG
jgi:hypothetical protein